MCERVKRCIQNLGNTHLHNLTMRWLKPYRHTCSTWLTDGASRQARHLRLTIGWPQKFLRNSAYDSMCKRDKCLDRELNMSTQRRDLVNDHNMSASDTLLLTCKSFPLNAQVRWVKMLTGAHGVSPRASKNQVKTLREALKLNACQNCGGCCSCYNTWRQISRTPASIFWLINITGPWYFREY